jgi:DNA-binding NarL/FixJ family response regulator
MRRTKKHVLTLTAREQEILELIWDGLQNREIAKNLQISVKTVEAHRANMMRKLRVRNAALLLKAGFELGFLRLRRRAA